MMRRLKVNKGLKRLNKITWILILFFLVFSISYYSKMEPKPVNLILMISCIALFVCVGGLKFVPLMAEGMSDGIDIPGGI